MSKRRSFSKEQKLQILREAETEGMLATCRKHEIAQSLFYRWRQAFEQKGMDGLQGQYYRVDPEIKALEAENERLKKIIGSLNQQVVFNRKKNPSYAAKMKTTMNIVRKRLGKDEDKS